MSLAMYSSMSIGEVKHIIKGVRLITIEVIEYKFKKCYKVTINKIQAFNEYKYGKRITCIKQLYSVIYQDLSKAVL